MPKAGTFGNPRNLLSSQPDANPKRIPRSVRNQLQPPRQKECANVLVGAAIHVTTSGILKIRYLVRIAHSLRMKKRAFEEIDAGGMSKVARLSRRSQGEQHVSSRNLRRSARLG